MKAELKKGSPDFAVIARKMDRTFTYRWKKINDPKMSVEDILVDFPVLQERNFVSGIVISFSLGGGGRAWGHCERLICYEFCYITSVGDNVIILNMQQIFLLFYVWLW